MIVYPFRAVLPKRKFASETDQLAEKAKYQFAECLDNGELKQAVKAGIYVYEIITAFGTHLGFVAQTDLQEFVSKNIKPHEKTLKPKEVDAKTLLLDRGSLVKPVLVCHLPNEDLTALLENHRDNYQPALTIRLPENSDLHRVWPIRDKSTIKQLQHLAGFVDHAYIADGHHRSKVLQQLSKKSKKHDLNVERVCSAYFDFNSVQILDYNRMVEIDSSLKLSKFLKKLEKKFTITTQTHARKPNQKHQLSMFLDGQWYELCWKPEILAKYQKLYVILDHQVFDKEVLNKILKIKNVTKDKSITYFSGENSTEEIEQKLVEQPRTAAFFIYPVEIEQMVQLTEKDKTLPPKSTYFVPRLYNGIICDDLRQASE